MNYYDAWLVKSIYCPNTEDNLLISTAKHHANWKLHGSKDYITGVFRTQSKIWCLTGFWIRLCVPGIMFVPVKGAFSNKLIRSRYLCHGLDTRLFRSSHQNCSIKNVFLENSQKLQENTCARASFLIKLQA